MPSAIKLTTKEANTITQPQPPSGGLASEMSSDSLDDEEVELESTLHRADVFLMAEISLRLSLLN